MGVSSSVRRYVIMQSSCDRREGAKRTMLSDRRQRILGALIEEYVSCALPVGSRTLTERYQLGVSPATVRNDLSALEDAGYITQPHTSAGRVPTDAGYRAFVDELLGSEDLMAVSPGSGVVEELRQSATELDELLERTSAALSRLTDCLSIVAAPSLFSAHIRQISLISLSNRQALIVVVTEDGQTANRSLCFSEDVSAEQLSEAQSRANELLAGKTFAEPGAEHERMRVVVAGDPLLRYVIDEVLLCVQENGMGRAHKLGLGSLLTKPEFSDSAALAPVVDMVEDSTALLSMLDQATEGSCARGELLVRIGAENPASALRPVSVIAGTYGRGEGEGIIAVIGPTRMNYSGVIRAVRTAQVVLNDDV